MTNTPLQFDYHSHSMAQTAVIIHEYLIDTPQGNAAMQWKQYVSENGIAEGRSRIVDFAQKLEILWSSLSEQESIKAMSFDCFDLDYVPCVISFFAGNLDSSGWWQAGNSALKMFTLFPTDQ